MTPKERVERVLKGGHVDKVPFTVYTGKIPQCNAERVLRNRGLCIVKNDIPVFKTGYSEVKITQQVYWEKERQFTRTFYETPAGTISTLHEHAGFTFWAHEKMFKGPDDYKAILFLIKSEVYRPNYEEFTLAEERFGGGAVFRASFGLEPLQEIISGNIMKMQDFCLEWMDRRDEILKIYEAIVENRRNIYPLVAQSPALHANYGGNVTPEIIGLDTFEKYYVAHYDEAAEIMHKHKKLVGCHFDANCGLIADAIAATALDYIEAFTPAPDTDMTLSQARQTWSDKVLWLNFPSSLHLKPPMEIEELTVKLLNEIDSMNGLLMGITEDVPENRWRANFAAIMDGIDRHARENPTLYTSPA